MSNKIIVIGASAGGFRALGAIFASLAPDLDASIIAVLHTSPRFPSYLDRLLSKTSTLPVKFASNEAFQPGTIYVAPPDHHVIVERSDLRLSQGPKENNARPAIDVTFRSAAVVHRERVTGVLLTGMLDDGTAGLFYIKRYGGMTIVQDPYDAEFPSMPANALAHVRIDHKLPLHEIAQTVNRWAAVKWSGAGSMGRFDERHGSEAMIEQDMQRAVPTAYTCPNCRGPLFRIDDGSPTRFRCRVGHAYGSGSLHDAQANHVEDALWSSFQALIAKAELEENLRQEAEANGDSDAVEAWKKCLDDTQRRIADFAQVLELSPDELATAAKSRTK